jgi:hypothetical protein
MDPFLELHWRDVHHSLIQYTRDSLQPQLPPDLCARIDERVFLETGGEQGRHFYPDVAVSRYPQTAYEPMTIREGGGGVVEPIVFEAEEITEGFIEIRESRGGKLITVIEFLSPTNKRSGGGQEEYLQKQREILSSDANLVEIDLVRGGRRVLALAESRMPAEAQAAYLACISPGGRRGRRELFVMPLRSALPTLPIPLRQSDAPVKLDLQELVDRAYLSGRYHTLDYSLELDPPLAGAERSWAQDRLKQSPQPK